MEWRVVSLTWWSDFLVKSIAAATTPWRCVLPHLSMFAWSIAANSKFMSYAGLQMCTSQYCSSSWNKTYGYQTLWQASHFLDWPHFFLAISFSTSLLAMAIAFEASELLKRSHGSGRSFWGLKYCHIDIVEQLKHSMNPLLSIKMASMQDRVSTVCTHTIL